MTEIAALTVAVYSMLTFVGGVIGFVKKKSLPSLISGLVFSLLLDAAAYGLFAGLKWAIYLAAGVSLFLLVFFAVRYVRSSDRAFMPSGLMTLMSLVTLAAIYLTYGKT